MVGSLLTVGSLLGPALGSGPVVVLLVDEVVGSGWSVVASFEVPVVVKPVGLPVAPVVSVSSPSGTS
ncbi:hypothetical protein [Nannocystis pusilla]|uniref:hypothetical protein n=1 Tax=Nannocystis pusilla TaxID=889268 RepID=UPI003B807F30